MFKMMIQVRKNNIGILFIESLKQDTKGSLMGAFLICTEKMMEASKSRMYSLFSE